MIRNFYVIPICLLITFIASAETITVGNASQSIVDIGDGKDGAFENGPIQTGVTISGSSITFDTDTKAEFNFTSFELSSGFVVTVTGSEPLIIRVLTDAVIAGTVDLNGKDGGNTGTSISGGEAVAGAGAGGDGGVSNGGNQPTNGSPSSGNSRGGVAGTNQVGTGAQRGGGGGCNGSGAANGDNNSGSAGACTLSQSEIADEFESSFAGGGGGSGGGARSGAAGGNGAGGGSGGGAFHFVVGSDLTLSGSIQSIGGSGGDGNFSGTDCGASGGGGSGGSIWLQVGDLFLGSGSIDVSSGSGGTDLICSYDGGAGSRGVVRVDRARTSWSGTVSPLGDFDLEYDMTRSGEYDLQGAFYCGSLGDRQNTNRGLAVLAFWFSLYFSIYLGTRFSVRSITVQQSN